MLSKVGAGRRCTCRIPPRQRFKKCDEYPNMKRLFLTLYLASLASLTLAGGSVAQAELEPILGKLAPQWEELKAAYEIAEIGSGIRIGSQVNEHLGGMRVLPFSFQARPKGSTGEFTIVITITGENIFTDSKGKIAELPDDVACELHPKAIEVHKTAE